MTGRCEEGFIADSHSLYCDQVCTLVHSVVRVMPHFEDTVRTCRLFDYISPKPLAKVSPTSGAN